MPVKSTIVFDLDGTLVDSAPDLVAALNEVLQRRGRTAVPMNDAIEMIGRGARVLIQKGMTATGSPVDENELDRMFDEFVDHYSDHIADGSRIFPGADAALDRLAAKGYRVAMCTNKPHVLAKKLVSELGIEHHFAALLGGDSLDFRKPDPRHLFETISKAGGDPALALLVGDSITDVSTAKAAKVPVIGVSFGYTDTPMAELGPDRLIEHFDDLDAAITDLLG